MADVPNLDNDAADGSAEFAAALEQLNAQERLAAEAAERRKKSARELRDMYGDFASTVDKAAKRNADLMRSMNDGTFARQARDLGQLNRQYERMRREVELTARFGNGPGGWLARNERAIGAVGRVGSFAAGATLASGAGLVRQGFAGTVESARLERETKMLAREFSGAMKPLIDWTTRGVRSLREFMEGLSPTGQNLVALGGSALAASTALRVIGGGGLIASGARAVFMGGGASLAATAAVSAAAGAGGGAAGGAAAGAAGAGAAGAAGWATRAAGFARAGGYAGAIEIALSQLSDITSDPSTIRALGRQGIRGLDFFAGGELARMAGFKSGGPLGQGYDAVFGVNPNRDKDFFEKLGVSSSSNDPANPTRRQVSIAGGGFDEPGAAYSRLNSAISMVEAESTTPLSDGAAGGAIAELSRAATDLKAAAADLKSSAERRDSPPLRRPSE